MPKFSQEKEFTKYLDDIKEAEDLLNKEYDVKNQWYKYYQSALRITTILYNVFSVECFAASCLSLINIPVYLLSRVTAQLGDRNEELFAHARIVEAIKQYNKIISKADDPEVIEKLQNARDRLVEIDKKILNKKMN